MERARREGGFTVLELMIIVMIIGILVATAMPAFARARERAQDRAAQSALVDAAKAVLIIGLDSGAFPSTATLLAELPAIEPAYTWLDHTVASTAPDAVSIDQDAGGAEVEMAALSESGTCFYLRAVLNGATEYHQSDSDPCTSHWFQPIVAAGWS